MLHLFVGIDITLICGNIKSKASPESYMPKLKFTGIDVLSSCSHLAFFGSATSGLLAGLEVAPPLRSERSSSSVRALTFMIWKNLASRLQCKVNEPGCPNLKEGVQFNKEDKYMQYCVADKAANMLARPKWTPVYRYCQWLPGKSKPLELVRHKTKGNAGIEDQCQG